MEKGIYAYTIYENLNVRYGGGGGGEKKLWKFYRN